MDKINYSDYFGNNEKINYAVKLELSNPKENYNLKSMPKGINIDINETFKKAVEKFNTHSSRVKDNAKISDIQINEHCI